MALIVCRTHIYIYNIQLSSIEEAERYVVQVTAYQLAVPVQDHCFQLPEVKLDVEGLDSACV